MDNILGERAIVTLGDASAMAAVHNAVLHAAGLPSPYHHADDKSDKSAMAGDGSGDGGATGTVGDGGAPSSRGSPGVLPVCTSPASLYAGRWVRTVSAKGMFDLPVPPYSKPGTNAAVEANRWYACSTHALQDHHDAACALSCPSTGTGPSTQPRQLQAAV